MNEVSIILNACAILLGMSAIIINLVYWLVIRSVKVDRRMTSK